MSKGMGAALPPLDLSRVPSNFITMLLQSMSIRDRSTCALVCKAWAQEATAAIHSIILRHSMHDLSSFQIWLERHGDQLEVLQLHEVVSLAVLTALPCPQLQDLLLSGRFSIDGSVWSDIAAASKLTSVSLDGVQTDSQHADVVSALTALPDLEQLSLCGVECGPQRWLTYPSNLLQKLTKLTALRLSYDPQDLPVATAESLEHLGLLTRLQDLTLSVTEDWAAAGCPGLQELKALTRLRLLDSLDDIPTSVSQLTALRQLDVSCATPTALNRVHVLTGLTRLRLKYLQDLLPESPPLQLPGLQHLEVLFGQGTMHPSFLASCTQLQVLILGFLDLCPCSLVASTMLQHAGA